MLDNQEGAKIKQYVSGSSWRDVSNADPFDTDTIPTAEISSVKNRPRGV